MANQYIINTNIQGHQYISFDDGSYATFEVLSFIGEDPDQKDIYVLKTNNRFLSGIIENGQSIHANLAHGYDAFRFEGKILVFK